MPETRQFYQITVFGADGPNVSGIDLEERTSRLYGSEEKAWEDARETARALHERDGAANVFVTECEAEISLEKLYDVPVMPEKK